MGLRSDRVSGNNARLYILNGKRDCARTFEDLGSLGFLRFFGYLWHNYLYCHPRESGDPG